MATIEKRIRQDGTTHHRVKVRIKGFPVQSASFDRLTDARRWAQATEAAIRERRYFKTQQSMRHTLGEAIDRYAEEVLPSKSKSTVQAQATQLAWWREALGPNVLGDVTTIQIGDCRDRLLIEPQAPKSAKVQMTAKRRTPATVVRYLAALSHVFSVATKEWGWTDENPVLKVRKPREPKGRERFLTDVERQRLLEACSESQSPYLLTVVVLAISTGMRRGEIMGLRWHQVDLESHRIVLRQTKNGETRSVPLVGLAHQQVQMLANHSGDKPQEMVFQGEKPGTPMDLKRSWRTALHKAEICDFRFHDLRHSAASYLAMNGASVVEIATVLGHKTMQMVKRYAHLNDAHTRRIVADMNGKIFGNGGEA